MELEPIDGKLEIYVYYMPRIFLRLGLLLGARV